MNPYAEFRKLFPGDPLVIARVIEELSDGTTRAVTSTAHSGSNW